MFVNIYLLVISLKKLVIMEREEAKSNDLELKIRVVKAEIRENKREKDKRRDIVMSAIFVFVGCIGVSLYLFFNRQEYELWMSFFIIFFLLLSVFAGWYWYNKYKKTKKQMEKLEKELKRLKEGLKD